VHDHCRRLGRGETLDSRADSSLVGVLSVLADKRLAVEQIYCSAVRSLFVKNHMNPFVVNGSVAKIGAAIGPAVTTTKIIFLLSAK